VARIRTIKPEIWTDEKLSECSLSAHLLFIGLISFADDEGRMEYAPARIRMQIFPCGRVPPKKLTELIGELTERSLIRVYVVDNREFLDIPGFIKHQRINRPTPSKLPAFHGVLSEPSVSPQAGMEWKGKERNKEEERESKRRASKTCPADFEVTAELLQWAQDEAPGANVDSETATFREFEFQRPYSNWPATWKRWIRRAHERKGINGNGSHQSAPARKPSAVERVYAATAHLCGDNGSVPRSSGMGVEIPDGALRTSVPGSIRR